MITGRAWPADGSRRRGGGIDIIQRSLRNVFANWPLLLIRIAEAVAVAIVMVGAFVAAFLPSAIGVFSSIRSGGGPEQFAEALLAHPVLLILGFLVVCLGLVAALAIHAFIEAGAVGIYLEGWKAAAALGSQNRQVYDRFSSDAWIAHARRSWWKVFLVYNAIWGLFGLILILPLIAIGVAIVGMVQQNALAAIGCLGAGVLIVVTLVASLIFNVWTRLAVADAVERSGTAGESVRRGWQLIFGRLSDVVVVVAVFIGVSIGTMVIFGSLYFVIGIISNLAPLASLPVQLMVSLGNNVLSVILSGWLAAAMAGVLLKSEGSPVYGP